MEGPHPRGPSLRSEPTIGRCAQRFGIRDKALEKIAAMVHNADLHDEKFHAPAAEGIDRLLAGLARLGWSDQKILEHGFICFEGLHAQVKAS